MSTSPAPARFQIRLTRIVLGLVFNFSCIVAGFLVPSLGYYIPLYMGLGVAGFLAMATLFAVFGVEGGLLAASVLAAFFLMQRFDEGFALPLGDFELRGFYIAETLLLAALFLVAAARDVSETVSGSQGYSFAIRIMGFWAAFVFFGAFTIITNRLFDDIVEDRRIAGELLAWYSIVMPILFLPLALSSKISHQRALWCLHLLVGLAGAAGLILSMFGVLPGRVLGLLGWEGTIQGTVDLVRGRLPLGHPNHVAAVMNMLLPIAVIYGFLGKGWHWRLFHLGCAFFILFGVLFALSRGALINLVLVFLASLAYVFLTRENRRWYTPLLMFGAILIPIIATVVLFQVFDFSRFWSRGYYEDASVERRTDSMQTAVAVWWDHPILGASPNAVYPRLEMTPKDEPLYEDSISPIFFYRGMVTAETPHNLFLIVPAEFGLVGAVLFFGMLAYMGYTLLKLRRLPGLDRQDRQLMTAFALSLGATLLSGVFEAILFAGMRVNVIFWVLFGVAFVYTFQAVANRSQAAPAPGP